MNTEAAHRRQGLGVSVLSAIVGTVLRTAVPPLRSLHQQHRLPKPGPRNRLHQHQRRQSAGSSFPQTPASSKTPLSSISIYSLRFLPPSFTSPLWTLSLKKRLTIPITQTPI
ncbi:MAG: hypothetical protein M5U34_27110 [Chloroflexi bacterium]|nr:hypothetical protein [Chloroflexota bacterium]